MADYEFCKLERDGRLLHVTLNRPDVMNALHPPAHFELARAFDEFADDPELWIAIVTGAVFLGLAVKVYRDPQPKLAMALFGWSITYVTLLFGAMAVDVMVRNGL